MEISILVPVYGVEKFIGRCARSLFGQTFADIEYVFVDDCSPDASITVLKGVLEEFPHRKHQVKIVRHEHNKGLSVARNTALDNAIGKYLLFVDSDDYLEPEAVRLLYDKAEQEEADLVVYDMKLDFGDKTVDYFERIPADRHDYVKNLIMRRNLPSVCGKLFACHLFGPDMRFAEGLNYGEDYIMSPRLAYKARKIVKLDRTLYGYVKTNTGSLTTSRSRERDERNMRDIECAVDILCSFFSQVPEQEIYVRICDRIKIFNKILLLKKRGSEIRRRAVGLYPEVRRASRLLGMDGKIILMLARCQLWVLLDAFLVSGWAIKRILRNLKTIGSK